jgi:hypothetical protein
MIRCDKGEKRWRKLLKNEKEERNYQGVLENQSWIVLAVRRKEW